MRATLFPHLPAPRIAVVLVSAATAVVIACGSPPDAEQARRPAVVPVRTVAASTIDLAEQLEAGGVVIARESAAIASRVVAPVLTVRVHAGDHVGAGDLLVTLDGRDLSAQARQAGAAAAAAEQALSQAQALERAAAAEQTLAAAWHTRIAGLRARDAATAQELDDAEARRAGAAARDAGARAAVAQASAQLTSARAAAEAAAVVESFAVIRAPFAGVVAERSVDPGDLATPGDVLLRLEADGRRRVEARVDEARVAYVRPGDRVDVFLHAADEAAPALEGTVGEIARAVDTDQRTFTVKVDLPSGVTTRSGTFARVRFQGAGRPAVIVPAEAIRRQGQVASVFVVAAGVARLRLVRTGEAGASGVEVLAGLDAGELVVDRPSPSLADGDPVTLASGSAGPGVRP